MIRKNKFTITLKTLILIWGLSLLLGFSLHAKAQQNNLPGDTLLPSSKQELGKLAELDVGNYKYSVEDYFQKPKQSTFRFSPNGNYLSYRQKDKKGKRHIYVTNVETNKTTLAVAEGEDLISEYGWANNDRLFYIKDKGGNENYHLFAVNLDGENKKSLTPFDKVKVNIIDELKDQKDYMIIIMNKENAEVFEPYKINLNTGELKKIFENKDANNPIDSYFFDENGILKAYSQQQKGTSYSLKYRLSENLPFKTIVNTSWQDTFWILAFNEQTKYPHDAYVLSNLENDTNEVILYDFLQAKTIKKVFAHPIYDVDDISISRNRGYEVDYIEYNGKKRVVEPISNTFKKFHKKLVKQFKDKEVSIISNTDDEDKYLLYVSSDRLYGIYYIYGVKKDHFQKVFNLMPQLKPEEMATVRPIQFTSRDGLTLQGYMTIPKGANIDHKVPLIMNPHGGPYGERDSWGFNPETQLFASRGYATLQINYRGSGGYGKKFFLAGSKQIGRKMLNDLEDAVAYAKTLDFINVNKTAIYGGSYGGLATLGSLVKTPDMYSCGVDYVGVSNLFTFYQSFPDYWKPFLKQVYAQWYDETDPVEKKIITEISPALNVDKINKPLFVIQGANDPRVNINESDQIVKSLRARGFDTPYMVKYNEGHGFRHEENRIELYRSMMGFFSKCLKGK